jgi:hypothetical protein
MGDDPGDEGGDAAAVIEALSVDLTPNTLTAQTLRTSELRHDVHYAKDAETLFEDLVI